MSGLIAGASQYLNAATLANKKGTSAQSPSLLGSGGFGDSINILDIGRGASNSGLGISSRARALNAQQIASNEAGYNALFSLSAGTDATVDGAKQMILALRSRMTDDQLAPSLRSDAPKTDTTETDTARGSTVDTTA